MKYTDEQRLQKILDNAVKLNDYINEHDIKKQQLIDDFALQWLVTTPLYNIGEHVYNLSEDLKENYPDIPWNMIAGLRHRLIHDYDGTNWNIIVDVVFDELPVFIEQVQKITVTEND